MKSRILILCILIITSYKCYAQFSKIEDSKYHMSIEPVVGSLHGETNIIAAVNPNLTLKSKGFLYGLDWVSARWGKTDNGILVPKLQFPIKVRLMKAGEKTLFTSDDDGTFFPKQEFSSSDPEKPFNTYLISVDCYFSPYYFEAGLLVISPKFGLGMDVSNHKYNVDLSKFLGKAGTDSTSLTNFINSSYSPFYSYNFWEDLYGINLGTYIGLGKRIMIDAGWEYYPVRFLTKMSENTIHTNWNAVPNVYESKHSKLSRLTIKGQLRIVSWASVFVKWENSNFKFEGPIIRGDQKFYQKYSNLLFGITIGGPKLD